MQVSERGTEWMGCHDATGGIGRLLAVYLGENDSHSGLVGTHDGPDAALGKRLQMPKT